MKKLLSPLATTLLLAFFAFVPTGFPSAPAAVHAAAQKDTIKEYTRPAKAPDGEHDDRSVKAPVPWLIVEDQRIEACNADGKCETYSSHPILRLNGEGHTALARGFDTWNKQGAKYLKKGFDFTYDCKKGDRQRGFLKGNPYFDYSVITEWGRIDEHMISFRLFSASYSGGIHPMHGDSGMNFDTQTGKEVDLAAVVSSRKALLQALAVAFRTQYPNRAEELFAYDITQQLERFHAAKKGFDTFSWYMGTRGELVFLYPPYTLAPYASGDFTLTIERADAPQLFTKAYPLN